MRTLSQEAKNAILKQVINREGKPIRQIAKENNVSLSALDKWRNKAKLEGAAGSPQKLPATPAERFEHILATAPLAESERGAYCRERGLYDFQLQQWKEEFIMQSKDEKEGQQNAELKALRIENKVLKNDLQRKDKALAEASALLILKKKAALIWGDEEDDLSTAKSDYRP